MSQPRDSMEQGVYHCPHCGAEVPDVGQKVFVHKTFCRDNYDNFAKGNVLQKSTMESTFELVNVDLMKDWPWGMTQHKRPDGGVTIRYKARSLVWPFLGIYILAVGAFEHLSRRLDEQYILYVFFALTAVHFLCALVYTIFAKWELTIQDGTGVFFGGIGKFGRTIEFEYNSHSTVAAVRLADVGRDLMGMAQIVPDFFTTIPMFVLGSLVGNRVERQLMSLDGITVVTDGTAYTFGGTIPNEKAKRYMAAYLLREIAKQ